MTKLIENKIGFKSYKIINPNVTGAIVFDLGTRIDLGNGVIITAMTVLNALGNVVLPNGEILAGNRSDLEGEKYKTFGGFSQFLTPLGGQISRGSNWNNLDVDIIGQVAANAVQESIYDACYQAESIKFYALNGVIPSSGDYK